MNHQRGEGEGAVARAKGASQGGVMQVIASGLAKEASNNSLERSLTWEVWKPNSPSPASSNSAVPERDCPEFLLGIPCCTSSQRPLAELPEALQTSVTGGLRGHTSLCTTASKGLLPRWLLAPWPAQEMDEGGHRGNCLWEKNALPPLPTALPTVSA